MYAASIEGLGPEERADFDRALAQPLQLRPPRALGAGERALRAVPDLSPDQRARLSAERLEAIRSLGGDVSFGDGG